VQQVERALNTAFKSHCCIEILPAREAALQKHCKASYYFCVAGSRQRNTQ